MKSNGNKLHRRPWWLLIASLCVLYFVYVYLNSMQSKTFMGFLRRQAVRIVSELPSAVLEPSLNMNRDTIIASVQKKMLEAVKLDKGSGCAIPNLNPFAKEATRFDQKLVPLKCHSKPDWVKCYHSKCHVLEHDSNVTCSFQDILYQGDFHYTLGPITHVKGGGIYHLNASDYAQVACSNTNVDDSTAPAKWSGNVLGFRPIQKLSPPYGSKNGFHVVILAIDSTSKTGFIRLMPRSWKVLNEELEATIMDGYNIVGDGTSATLFPLLTGHTELELPDVRKGMNNPTLDNLPFIFHKLKENGYYTAYFEDMPSRGTFQFRYNGFRRQPADHYNRAFIAATNPPRQEDWKYWNFCLGDTPQYKVMMNMTEQFLELDGKRFILTFISDITHDDFNKIQWADNEIAAFLRRLLKRTEDTLVVVMGDHGPRYAKIRKTNSYRGKLDERLPLLAIRLPSRLMRQRPDALRALQANSRELTTPHDLHATLLDVLDMRQAWNNYQMPGSDLKRGLTMLEPITPNRSCSEAGIEPHWCTCRIWQRVAHSDPLFNKSANALLLYINALVKEVRPKCIQRKLQFIGWVLRLRGNRRLLSYSKSSASSYVAYFNASTIVPKEDYQVQIVINPGRSLFEASMTYTVNEDKFVIRPTDISRTDYYGGQSDCIADTHPHLAAYCFCQR